MNREKVLTLIGFAAKSGNLISGQENVLKSLGKKKVYLVFCASDMAEGSKEKIIRKSEKLAVALSLEFTIAELSKATGKINRTVIAVKEQQFAQQMLKQIAEMDKE